MHTSSVVPSLIEACRTTEYRVNGGGFVLHIGRHAPRLAALFRETGATCAAFIAAFNPRREPCADGLDHAAHERLGVALATAALRVLPGSIHGAAGACPPAASYLALGLDFEPACRLGREFGQDAIVWAGTSAVPLLVILRWPTPVGTASAVGGLCSCPASANPAVTGPMLATPRGRSNHEQR